MAFRRPPSQAPAATVAEVAQRDDTALVAAGAQVMLDQIQVSSRTIRDLEWQQEAWRHYDICGEFRFTANRHAAAISRVKYSMVEVDNQGRPGKETKDKAVQALADSLFGNEADKAEAFRVAGINLYVAGECWIVAEGSPAQAGQGPQDQPPAQQYKTARPVAGNPKTGAGTDTWYVVSAKELKKEAGVIKVRRPEAIGGGWKILIPGQDILIRCWTPHPRLFDVADSPTRAVLPILREIERLTMLSFSLIDSRLALAGLLLLPDDIDFPHKQGQSPVQGLMEQIIEAAKQNLQGAGNAAGIVPIAVGVPRSPEGRANLANLVAHVKFDSPLTPELDKKLDQAIRRLALGLDVNPEELLGQGDSNHWAAWQIEESSIKLFIEPAAARLCQALNMAYIRQALVLMGKDPDKFMLWYNTAPLVVRPNRQADAIQLSSLNVIGNEAVRNAGDWDEDDKPSAEELVRREMWALCQLNPALAQDPIVAQIMGWPQGIGQAAIQQQQQMAQQQQDQSDQFAPGQDLMSGGGFDDGSGQPGMPSGAQGNSGAQQNALPQQPGNQGSPAQQGLQSSARSFAYLAPAAEMLVLDALEQANKRQLTRSNRGQYRDVALVELHTRVRPENRQGAYDLLDKAGAFSKAALVAGATGADEGNLRYLLREYCAELLVRGYAHAPENLAVYLAKVRTR